MMKKFCLVFAVLLVCLSLVLPVSAQSYDTSIGADHLEGAELKKWLTENFVSKSTVDTQKTEYSFAFVGDTQYITYSDYRDGTDNLGKVYGWLADNLEEKKVEHVFILGDMTERSYKNDKSISGSQTGATGTDEWEIVQKAVSKIDGKVSYSAVRGNHDDFQISKYIGTESYRSQFDGFFVAPGDQANAIMNSYKLADIHGDKYLFMTIDFNPRRSVINWANEIIASHTDRKVIITTHSYISSTGKLLKYENDTSSYKTWYAVDGEYMWENLVSKHKNIIMVACGHVSSSGITYSFKRGDHGNKVLQVLIDPQSVDKYSSYTGMIAFMHFSEDGMKIELEHYSTLHGLYRRGDLDTIRLDDAVDNTKGDIDMAELSEYGQTNMIVEKATASSPLLDGIVGEGEYSSKRQVAAGDKTKGKVPNGITEYFAYDEDNYYYAFSGELPLSSKYDLKLHFGSTSYTVEQLNKNQYMDSINVAISQDSSVKITNLSGKSNFILGEDIEVVRTRVGKEVICETRISRDYLRNNNYHDNIIGYTLFSENSQLEYYEKIGNDLKSKLTGLGVRTRMVEGYNYVFLGEKPEYDEVNVTPDPVEPTVVTSVETSAEKKGGCKGTLSLSALALIAPVVVLCTTKKRYK